MARKPRQKAEPKASLEQLIQGRGVHIGFGPDGDVMVSDLKGEMTDDLFVIRSVAPEVSLGTVFRGVIPFCIADCIKLALVIAIPALALWLPATTK